MQIEGARMIASPLDLEKLRKAHPHRYQTSGASFHHIGLPLASALQRPLVVCFNEGRRILHIFSDEYEKTYTEGSKREGNKIEYPIQNLMQAEPRFWTNQPSC
jgi:hypothetical protein